MHLLKIQTGFGINKTGEKCFPLFTRLDYVIDTSHLTAQGLLQELKEIYASGDTKQGLEINVMAFGFKYGMPLDAEPCV